jgi:hypothetical protein
VISADGLRQPHRALSALLEQVRLKCEWSELGCLEQPSLPKLAAHAARCEHNPHLCDGPGCVEANRRLLCRGCKVRRYCSKECLLRHWESGHREECRRARMALELAQPAHASPAATAAPIAEAASAPRPLAPGSGAFSGRKEQAVPEAQQQQGEAGRKQQASTGRRKWAGRRGARSSSSSSSSSSSGDVEQCWRIAVSDTSPASASSSASRCCSLERASCCAVC